MTVTEAMEALEKAMEREKEDRWCLCGHRWSWHKPIRKAADAQRNLCSGGQRGQCPCTAFREEDGQ